MKRDELRDHSENLLISDKVVKYLTKEQKEDLLGELKEEMKRAAKNLEFERAAQLRDEIERLETKKKSK